MDHGKINRNVARTVTLFWLLGWYLKLGFYSRYLLVEAYRFPVVCDFFPPLFLAPEVSGLAYFLPVVTLAVLFLEEAACFRISAVLMTTCAAVMNLHINTHNDATFVTSFWVGLWLMWLSFQLHRTDASFRLHARVLAQGIVGMIFLGGAVGKMTPRYESGEIMYGIFFTQYLNPPVRVLLDGLSQDVQRSAAAWISKTVIGGEWLLALSPFFPHRWTAFFAVGIFFIISLFSTWRIFSVTTGLMGMLLAGLLWHPLDKGPQNIRS